MIDLEAARKAAREARERADKATPGPWRQCGADRGGCVCALVWSTTADLPVLQASDSTDCGEMPHPKRIANAEFAAHARAEVPALAALVQEMATEIERLRSMVEMQRTVIDEFVPRVGG